MAPRKSSPRSAEAPLDLGRRERQIMEAVYRLGEATVGQVLAELTDPVSYSTIRTMLGKLERKELLRHRQDGASYVYMPTVGKRAASRSALGRVVHSFFAGSTAAAMSTLLDLGGEKISPEELDSLSELIAAMRREGR